MAVLGATNLTGCDSIPDFIAGGSLVTFQQTSAPTSWTKQTTHDNKALRVVTGTATPGGSTAFTTVFASRTPAGSVSVSVSGGTVNNTTLTTPQIPSHLHPQGCVNSTAASPGTPATGSITNGVQTNTGPAGGDGAHSHPFTVGTASGSFTGAALDFAVAYVDVIICSKN
jgi:hypothetical protein